MTFSGVGLNQQKPRLKWWRIQLDQEARIAMGQYFAEFVRAEAKRFLEMKILEVIKALNQMQVDGVIERYAIGGAVAATFYLEPVTTLDVDIFVVLKGEPGTPPTSPHPILDYLMAHGCTMAGEYVVIAGWPVQFLPPNSPLVEEALHQRAARDVGGIPTWIFSAEHLAAIALQAGRPKDKARLVQFIEAVALDTARFEDIVTSHHLTDALRRFRRQFLEDTP